MAQALFGGVQVSPAVMNAGCTRFACRSCLQFMLRCICRTRASFMQPYGTGTRGSPGLPFSPCASSCASSPLAGFERVITDAAQDNAGGMVELLYVRCLVHHMCVLRESLTYRTAFQATQHMCPHGHVSHVATDRVYLHRQFSSTHWLPNRLQ